MKPASVRARVAAFWLDALIIVTVLASAATVIGHLAPASQVRESPMQLFTARDFHVFWWNAAVALTFLVSYFGLLPLKAGATPGQRLARIRQGRPDGTPLDRAGRWAQVSRVFAKGAAVLLGGPLLAAIGGNFGLSLIGLVAPLLVYIVLSALAWSDPDGAGPQERAGNYRYFSTD